MALQASSKVKGITIEIGADTTSFGYAMNQLRTQAGTVAKDLKNVENALKLDPKNIEKAADKLGLLREAADTASKKVETIRKAIDGLNKEFEDKSSKEYRDQLQYLERQLESANREQEITNARLQEYQKHAQDAGAETVSLGKLIRGNLIADTIRAGLSRIVDLARSLANALLDAGKALAQFSWDSIQGAAAYNDALGYSEIVYDELSDSAIQWANDNSLALRISKKELTNYMNTLGQVFRSQGIDNEKMLTMTEDLMSLAADIRAATGKSTDDILPIMQRGFTTSVKNFRQFGVIMTEAEVKAYAAANGLAELTVDQEDLTKATVKLHKAEEKLQKLLDQGKEDTAEFEEAELKLTQAEDELNEVLGGTADEMDSSAIITARYMLLMERLNNIIGQNEREQELFNSQLALTDTLFKNLKDTIGLELLDTATELITVFNDFLTSEEGQAMLQNVVDQFSKWAKTIEDMIQDGRFADFLNTVIDNIPILVEQIGNIINSILELTPLVIDATNHILGLFGIKTEDAKVKEAFMAVERQISSFARQSGTDLDTMITAIHAYADEHKVDLLDIYNNWEEYQPKISEYIKQISVDAEGTEVDLKVALEGMTTSTETEVEKQITFWERLKTTISDLLDIGTTAATLTAGIPGIGGSVGRVTAFTNTIENGVSSFYHMLSGLNKLGKSNAQGGPVSAGSLLRVNDDAGHRTELFVPSVDGTILNGNTTDKIINNNNNSRTVGNVIVNLYTSSNNPVSMAEELGAEVQKRLRMSGAYLY